MWALACWEARERVDVELAAGGRMSPGPRFAVVCVCGAQTGKGRGLDWTGTLDCAADVRRDE